MQLSEAIELIQCPALQQMQVSRWADLGCGSGLFTRALQHYLPDGSTIYAADQQPPKKIDGKGIELLTLDFVKDPFPFGELDGVLMANSLHYVKDKPVFLEKVYQSLLPNSKFVIIEYDIEKAVPVWVPFPLSYRKLGTCFPGKQITRLGERPSAYGQGNMYAALISL